MNNQWTFFPNPKEAASLEQEPAIRVFLSMVLSGERFADEPGGTRFVLRAIWHLSLVADQQEKAERLLAALLVLVGEDEILSTLPSETEFATLMGAPEEMVNQFREFVTALLES